MGFARQQLNWDEFATATINDSQTVDTTGLPVSLHPCLWYGTVLLFYGTLTSTLEYLPTARSGYR